VNDPERSWSQALEAMELDLHHTGVADLTDRLLGWTPPSGLGPLPADQRERAESALERIRAAERALLAKQAEVRRDLDELVRRHSGPRDTVAPSAPRTLDTTA